MYKIMLASGLAITLLNAQSTALELLPAQMFVTGIARRTTRDTVLGFVAKVLRTSTFTKALILSGGCLVLRQVYVKCRLTGATRKKAEHASSVC